MSSGQAAVLPRVLLIRGMNKLVLDKLCEELSAEMEFVWAPVPVPLIGLAWLRDPWCLPCVFALVGGPVLLYKAFQSSMAFGALGVVLLMMAIQYLARFLVRGLLPEAVRVASSCLLPADGCCCAVGYSWGGGVLHHLLAQGQWQGPSLLLAPATTTIAFFADQGAAPSLPAAVAAKVTVVGCEADELCNATDMSAFSGWGARISTVKDEHTMLTDTAVRVIIDELRRLVSQAVARKKD